LRYFSDQKAVFIPVFADFRTNLLASKTSPYFSLDIGYSIGDGGGFMLNPTIGTDFKISNKASLNIGIGYEMQKLDFYGSYYYLHKSSKNSGALTIKLGVSF
jgi:outer membrane autotransporter protein